MTVGFFIFFIFCTRSPPLDPHLPPHHPTLSTGGQQGDTGSCLSGKQRRAHMPRDCAESCLPSRRRNFYRRPPPTLSADICSGGGGLISLRSKRTLGERTNWRKQAAQGCLACSPFASFSLQMETDLHLKELFRFRRQNKLLLWLKTGGKNKKKRHLFRLHQRTKLSQLIYPQNVGLAARSDSLVTNYSNSSRNCKQLFDLGLRQMRLQSGGVFFKLFYLFLTAAETFRAT